MLQQIYTASLSWPPHSHTVFLCQCHVISISGSGPAATEVKGKIPIHFDRAGRGSLGAQHADQGQSAAFKDVHYDKIYALHITAEK